MINYNDNIDCFTIIDGDRLNWFETILWYNVEQLGTFNSVFQNFNTYLSVLLTVFVPSKAVNDIKVEMKGDLAKG